MAMAISTVAPFAPHAPYCGGVIGGVAICVNGSNNAGADAADAGRFSVIDPAAGTQQAYQMTGSGGHNLGYGLHGTDHGGGVVCAFVSAASGFSLIQLVRVFANGSYDLLPTAASTRSSPKVVSTGSEFWVFTGGGTSTAPIVLNSTTLATISTSLSAGTTGGAQPVYLSSAVYNWSGAILVKYNTSTYATTNIPSGGNSPGSNAQAVIVGTKAYWPSATKIIELESSTDTVTVYTTGATFGSSLTRGSDGRLYGSNSTLTTIISWDPTTGVSSADSTGLTGLSNSRLAFTAAGQVCFPAAS
jgi:hypothetical protein